MVGKKKPNQLGRSLIKDRFSNTHKRKVEENMIHAADLNDGYDWARLNLNSVVEEDTFQDFLRKAELAGTEFAAEKLNIKFVNPKSNVGILTDTEKKDMDKLIKENENLLKIPRRPKWTKDTTLEELNANESKSFLEWRRDLSLLQENEGLIITPYEKNLEFWRQLWRVIERSDVLIQIVDARNPLLFRSEDLEKYVKEVDPNKQNILLLNKADFLTDEQREIWAKYFDEQNLKVAFFSAIEPVDDTIEEESEESEESENEETDSDEEDSENGEKLSLDSLKEKVEEISNNINEAEKELESIIHEVPEIPSTETEAEACSSTASSNLTDEKDLKVSSSLTDKNNSKILTRLELIEFFKDIRKSHPACKSNDNIVIGLMGYPNVGKSSTINALLQEKKVSVSATPGKTKHFQTLFLDREIILCDCCGLVLPSFCYTKADMILNGILPIDQMRDHVPPVNTLCTLIPRHILEDTYGILITKPIEGEDPNRAPHSEELLLAYGYNRGYMTANGQPDQSRSARRVLKDFVNGKLLHCYGPPTVDQNEYHKFPERQNKEQSLVNLPPRQQRAMKIVKKASSKDIDDLFFQASERNAHVKGRNLMGEKQAIRVNVHGAQAIGSTTSIGMIGKKSKAPKREKREKLRRKYAHLDQH